MNHELPSPITTEYQGNLPPLFVDPYFDSDKCPYEFDFDRGKFAKLLASQGVPTEKIESMRIEIKVNKGRIRKNPLGGYNFLGNIVTIWPENFFQAYNQMMKIAQKSAKTNRPSYLDECPIPTPVRLSEYLANPDILYDRKLLFAQKLIISAVERSMFYVATHEAGHKIDNDMHPYRFWSYAFAERAIGLSGVIIFPLLSDFVRDTLQNKNSGMPWSMAIVDGLVGLYIMSKISYEISPLERTANKFAGLVAGGNIDDWNVISFMPKEAKLFESHPWHEVKGILKSWEISNRPRIFGDLPRSNHGEDQIRASQRPDLAPYTEFR